MHPSSTPDSQGRNSAGQMFFMNNPLPLFVISEGLLADLNPEGEAFLGNSATSIRGKAFTEFLHPDDRQKAESTFEVLCKVTFSLELSLRILRQDKSFTESGLDLFSDGQGNIYITVKNQDRKSAPEGQVGPVDRDKTYSDLKLKSVFDILEVGILILDDRANVIDCNDAIVRMTGLRKDHRLEWEVLRDRWIILKTDLTPMAIEECPFYRSIVNKERIRDLVMGIQLPDRTIKWLAVNASPVMINGGGAVFSLTDISDTKNAQNKVIRSEALFRSVFELPLIGIALVSHDMGWSRVNQAFLDLLGYTKDEFVKISWDKMVSPEDLRNDLVEFKKALSGQALVWTTQREIIKKNGEKSWVIMSAGSVLKPDNSIDYFIVVIQDITTQKKYENEISLLNTGLEEMVRQRTQALITSNSTLVKEITARKQTEKELIENNTRSRLALRSAGAAIWDVNMESKHVYLSEEFNEIFIIKPGTIVDTGYLISRIHPEDRDKVLESISSQLAKTKRFRIRLRILNNSKQAINIEVFGIGVYREIKPQRFIGTCRVMDPSED